MTAAEPPYGRAAGAGLTGPMSSARPSGTCESTANEMKLPPEGAHPFTGLVRLMGKRHSHMAAQQGHLEYTF